jgi:hypothetical protein
MHQMEKCTMQIGSEVSNFIIQSNQTNFIETIARWIFLKYTLINRLL